ncbi:MAG: SurA N-terminal domain-containing protein [Spirochaetes bacterium]|nr:SurA N-terminal domain-containing protein [Spirochaetota bacterium]
MTNFYSLLKNRIFIFILTTILAIMIIIGLYTALFKWKSEDKKVFLNNVTNYLSKATLSVTGVTCSSCIQEINEALSDMKGISNVLVDIPNGRIQVYYDRQLIDNANKIAQQVTTNTDYPAVLMKIQNPEDLMNEQNFFDQKKEYYIAAVGEWNITRNDYEIELNAFKTQYANKYGENVLTTIQGKNLEKNLQIQVFNHLVNEALMLLDIEKADFSISNDKMEAEIDEYLTTNSLNMNQLIQNTGYPENYLKKKLSNTILINEYLEKNIFFSVPSNEERNRLYNQWFNNLKLLHEVIYYDRELEQNLLAASSNTDSCCP